MGDFLPTVSLGTGRTAKELAAGANHTCALLDNHTVKCWGNGGAGQLGYGDNANRGDALVEMGDNLPAVDLGTDRGVGPQARVTASITADETSVVVGQVIHYHVTITNTVGVTLTNGYAIDQEVLDCSRTVVSLAPEASSTADCEWTATGDDVPAMANVVSVSTDQGATAVSRVRRTRVDPVSIRPDAQLRLGAAAFIGDGVYNATGASQTRSTTVPNLGTATFTVRVQNDGNVVDDLTVLGQPTTSRYTVTYKDGPTNVTSQVVAGTYALNDLAPGATHDLTVTIKAKAGTPVNNLVNRLVTVTSTTDTSKKDAVKATVRRR